MNFIIYSKNGCPFCTKVERLMDLTEQQHIVYKLNRDFTREEFYEKFGNGSTFPRVLVDEQIIGGCTETVSYFKENNII